MEKNYTSKMHFFTSDEKPLAVGTLEALYALYTELQNEKRDIVVYFGYIQLGVLYMKQSANEITISKYGFCTFADSKSSYKGFCFDESVFDNMIQNGTTLENIVANAKSDIEYHVANGGNTYDMNGYWGMRMRDYIPYHHPAFALSEMVEARKVENRIIFWKANN